MSEVIPPQEPSLKINVIKCERQGEEPSEPSVVSSISKEEQWQQVYYSKVNEFYKAVETLKEKSVQKRIRPQVTQYLFYMVSQALIMLLKYLILNDRESPHIHTFVELFSITVFSSFLYFYAVETFQLGLSALMCYQFHLDQVQLSGIVAMIVGQYFIGLLGLGDHELAFRMAYPSWIFYLGSTTRIQVSLYRCNRFETFSAKVLLLTEFILTLITLTRYASLQLYHGLDSIHSAKQVSYLFLLAHALATAYYYKLYSQFDGTNALRYDFLFENSLEAKIRTQIKQLKKKLLNIESQTDH